MKRALLFVYIDTHFTELIRVARLLRNSGRYEATFFFEYHYGTIERDLKIASAEGFICLDNTGQPFISLKLPDLQPPTRALSANMPANVTPAARAGGHTLFERWQAFAARYREKYRSQPMPPLIKTARLILRSLRTIHSVFSWFSLLAQIHPELPGQLQHFHRQTKLTKRLIKERRPDLVILPEDNIAYATAALIRAGHKSGVPCVIVPFTIANALELAEAYWHNPDYGMSPWQNRTAAYLFPKWVYVHKGRRILPVRSAQIITMELFRLAPPLPWIINSGNVDAIAVESESMRRYYLQAGLPDTKLVLTGALSDDILAKGKADAFARRGDLYRELGLSPDRPLLLCALPPDQFRAGREGCDFSSYDELMDFWLKTLGAVKHYNVIGKLHPRMPNGNSAYFEQSGVKIAQWDTAELVPLCDIYVASVSATIRWAIACGKPVVNYDVYRFRYQDFMGVEGVLTMEQKADFMNTLTRLSQDADYHRDIRRAQELEAPKWANLDGRSGNRMLALFDSMIDRRDGKKAR